MHTQLQLSARQARLEDLRADAEQRRLVASMRTHRARPARRDSQIATALRQMSHPFGRLARTTD